MALPKQSLLYVSERDVDLLLVEELAVSPAFGKWLAQRAGLELSDSARLAGVWHSVTHPALGESDLIAIWREPDGRRSALLIENKIDACAQPDQGERYWQRGKAGEAARDWGRFVTCMVAPSRYLDSSLDARVYGSTISYETIREFFRSAGPADARSEYRASVLTAAIEQQRRGYSPVIDEHVSEFWLDFWRMSLQVCPRLGMTQPGPKPAGAGWIWVRPPELGGRQSVAFKLLLGIVDLQVNGAAEDVERIDALCVELLESEIRAVVTNKSTSLRIEVEPIDVTGDFQAQQRSLATAFEGAVSLLDAWKQIGSDIDAK